MFDSRKIADLIIPVVQPLTVEMPLGTAVDIILSANVVGLPVVDADHHVIGFLSEHDCLHSLTSSSYYCDDRLTGDVMHVDPITVSPELTAIELSELMSLQKPKIYPVTENDKLIGLVTRRQLIIELRRVMKNSRVTV